MISDRCAEDIARRLLKPFIERGMVTDAALASSIQIIKLRVEQDDNDRIIESANATIAVNTMLVDAIKGLPDA